MQSVPQIAGSATLADVKINILETLAYFDMFNYPLAKAEIYLFLSAKVPYEWVEHGLNCLLGYGIVYQFERFYTLKNNGDSISSRKKGNQKAEELIKTAGKVGELLIKFPYVRGIAISGSLSKNYADQHSDIDLFIITEKNRLWIARTLLHLFKKLTFLVGKEHFFCMNYLIDVQCLEIEEKNRYTAIEVCTLMPLQGDIVFEKFYAENAWSVNFLPNKTMRVATARPERHFILKSVAEFLFNNRLGNAIEQLLNNITAARWQKKTVRKKLNNHGTILGMIAGEHCSKPDPVNFQHGLLEKYQQKVRLIIEQHAYILSE
jgi:predicted nucleotidyltransferase